MSTWDDPKATWDDANVAWDGTSLVPLPDKLVVLPDIERVLVDFLRAQPELAELVGDRVYTVLPAHPDWPAVRVTRWGGSAVISRPLWLDRALVQADVWGGRKEEASEVARTLRAVLAVRRPAGVTAIGFGPLTDMPDESYVPARPRFLVALQVTFHPGPDAPDRSNRRPAALAALTP